MTSASIIKTLVVASAILMISAASASAQCATQTDEDLALAVMEKMRPKYGTQMNHINVRSKGGVVTLEGWAATKKIRSEVEKIAKKVKCVKKVENKLTLGAGGGCPAGSKPCGTICIPEEETCNIGKTKTD